MSFDPSPPRSPDSRNERIIVAALGLLFAMAIVAEVASSYEPAKLSILFMALFWIPLAALHEMGHAVVARALGWRVRSLVVGFGKPLIRFDFRGVPVEIRALPIEGFVRCAPTSLDSVRARSAAIYFAGPGIELLLACMILYGAGVETLLNPSLDIGVIALQSLALAGVLGAVLNLIPHSTVTLDGEILNDGLGIIWSLTADRREFEAWLEAAE